MRQALLTLSFLLLASFAAAEAVTVAGPVTVKMASSTLSLSDGLWTSYSPNIAYMLGRVGIGVSNPTNALDVLGAISLTTGSTHIEFGTKDSFSRPQIWNRAANSVLRLGSAISDGDSSDADSNGIIIYKPSTDYLARIKPDCYALRTLSTSVDYFHACSDGLYYVINSTRVFEITGTSVAIDLPLVFPDGSIQTTAATSLSISSITSSTNSWTANQNFLNKIGVSGTNSSGYALDINASDGNAFYSHRTSGNSNFRIESGGNVQLWLNSNTDGGSNQYSALLLMQNTAVKGFVTFDTPNGLLEIDNSNAIISNTGINITGSHRVGIGLSNPSERLETFGPIKISTNTTSVTITGSTATGAGSLLMGSNSPCSSLTAPSAWVALKIGNDSETYYIPACK